MDGWGRLWAILAEMRGLWDEIGWLIGGAAVGLGVAFQSGRLFERRLQRKKRRELESTSQDEVKQLNDVMLAFLQSDGKIWKSKQGPFASYREWMMNSHANIIAVANLKGGVSKTTTATNLAAWYARQGYPTLLIDLDWQGSASEIFGRKLELAPTSDVNQLFDPSSDGTRLLAIRTSADRLVPGLDVVRAYKPLLDLENRVMIDWLAGKLPFDAHYLLAKSVLDPVVTTKYKFIVMDTPPRLTTALVNALCAAKTVLIPTTMDGLSIETVVSFQETCRNYQREFNPRLSVAGVFGALASGINAEGLAVEEYRKLVRKAEPPLPDMWMSTRIPRKADFSNVAGKDIAVLRSSTVRNLFTDLAGELEKELQR